MQLKQAIEEIGGLKFIVNEMNIRSSAGRRACLSLPFCTRKEVLEKRVGQSETFQSVLRNPKNKNTVSLLDTKLEQLRDIKTTFLHLQNSSVLNDIELYEIKHFAILSESVRCLLDELQLALFDIPSLEEAVTILDPENKRIPHFHIYDRYSEKLASVRKEIERAAGADKEALFSEAEKLENEIRFQLSDKLRPLVDKLHRALDELARLDVELAKIELNEKWNLTKPVFSSDTTVIRGMFHPQVVEMLRMQGKDFQPIDIDIPVGPTVITGANMAGKSVLLKTVALLQAMSQFGFFVPAASAEIVPVESIFVSMGDGQDEMNGLSSFASEMLRVNEVIKAIGQGEKVLALIDELARTTNPKEGKAIVCGTVEFLMKKNIYLLITTHYSIDLECRKLKVKGFVEPRGGEKITSRNINNFIDYSLEETTENEVPCEAVRVAEIIGIDEGLLHRIRKFVK